MGGKPPEKCPVSAWLEDKGVQCYKKDRTHGHNRRTHHHKLHSVI